ncbi:MAG TPA: SMC family ATPase [Chloroflexi bacterium]|nr:SMC family ATPase [Chloroflexota bacterium]
MQIVALELENVKSYDHVRITFAPGVNAIVGHNGAGKSTIIEAIGYALFDALPYTAQEFVREGARSGTIAVTFISAYDERPYRIERRFGGSNAYAVYDDELRAKICDGKADVQAFVRRHTLADPSVDLTRLFTDALGVAQGSLTTAFAETPSKRKPIFDALLQVDDYSAAADKLREPVRRVRDQIVETDRTLAVLATRLEQLPILEQNIAQRAHALEDALAQRTKLETALAAGQTQLQMLEAQKTLVDTLTTQVARNEEQVRNLEERRQRALQARIVAEQAVATVAAHQAGHDAYLTAQQAQEALQTRAAERQALLNARSTADKTLALAAARCEQMHQALTEIAAAETMVQELAAAVAEQEALTAQMAALERAQAQMAELDHRLAAALARRQATHIRHAAVVTGCEQARAVAAQGQALNSRLAELRTTLEAAQTQVTLIGAELATLEQQSQALRDITAARCPVCEQPLTPDHRAEMLARNEAQDTELRRQLTEVQRTLATLQQELADGEAERTRLQHTWAQLPRESELADLAQMLAEIEAEIATASAARAELATQVAALDGLRQALAALGDPKSRSAVASAQAAQRPQIETQLLSERSKQAAALQQIEQIDQALAALGDLDQALAENANQLRTHSAAYQAVLTHRQLAATLPAAIAELTEIEQALQIADNRLTESRSKLKVAIAQFDQENYQQVLLDDRKLREELGSLSASLRLLQEAQAQDAKQVEALRVEASRHQALQQERQRLARLEEALEAIRTTIKQAGPFVTQALVHQVSEGAATIFGELMHDHSRVLSWNEDYGVTLTAGGAMRSFRQLSGGEQMSAALAVRLALVREMSNINIAFFDEPTANLDGVRREALAQQIMTVRGFNQLFVISHDDTFEQATQNLIRVTRYGNISAIVDAAK